MKKRFLWRCAGLICATAALCATTMIAQEENGDWHLTGGDIGQSGWQKGEFTLGLDNAASSFKFLWKIKLGVPSKDPQSFSEPLLAGRLINGQGFKDIVYWSSADTLFAVDSELGNLIWKKKFDVPTSTAASPCASSSLSMLMEPPIVINFNARRKRKPGAPRPPDAPPAATTERRLGVAPGGGYFGLKGIYVLTQDGMLHEQVMTTGADFAPPVKFLPAANASPYGLNFADHTIYTVTGRGCGDVPNGLWAIDLASGGYQVDSYSTEKVLPLALTGAPLTPEGNAIFVTGAGTADAAAGVSPSSVVSVSKDMKVQDWYTPQGGIASYEHVSPIIFEYKGRQLVVAPGEAGSIALLDAASLGGADHHTPLFETAPLAAAGVNHPWDGFATWQDKDGTAWVYASVSTGLKLDDSAIKSAASNSHGGIVAFKIDDSNGKLALNPVWVSPDMVNPAPPRAANGLVIGLAGGNSSTHAVLSVWNAVTGAELYSSKDLIPAYTHFSGVSIGDGHAFFTDRDNTLYSFGIGLEH